MPRAAATPVIDLCEVEEEAVGCVSLTESAVARMPAENSNVVSLLDDDDSTAAIALTHRRSLKRRRRRNEHPNEDRKPAAVTVNIESEVEVVLTSTKSASPLDRILEVFPDVRLQHAQSLLEKASSDVAQVLTILGEGSFPKEEHQKKAPPQGCVHRSGNTLEFQYDYMSISSFTPSACYVKQAIDQLLVDFPFLSKPGAKNLLYVDHNHYAVTYNSIKEAILGGPLSKNEDKQEVQYRLWKSAVSGVPLTATQEASVQKLLSVRGKATLVRPRRKSIGANVTDGILRDEIRFNQTKLAEWENRMRLLLQRKRARAKSVKEGTCLECMCCFDSVAFEEMVPCRQEGHLFCIDCVRRFAESQIFGAGNFGINSKTKKPALELLCMSGDGCASGFDRAYMTKALSGKVMEKYDELAFHASVNAAGIGDSMCACPKCGYEAALPETQMIFQCPVAECCYESCRKCGQESHIPMRCEEVERDKVETKGRLKVEEAISEAKIRTCPTQKCGAKFVKTDGCNKMTCSKCANWSCYVCRKAIPKSIGYKHFCQKFNCTHETCNGCPLYTKTEEDDKRAMREAGIEAAERVHEESLRSVDGKQPAISDVRVDVDSLL